MTRERPRNVGASIRARLLNRSRQTGDNFLFLLERYAAERFLYRLGESQYRERYVLKGAMLLVHWSEAVYRPTRDLDFTSYGSSLVSDVRSTIREICQTPVEDDGVAFDINDIAFDTIREHGEYDSVRARLKATLDYAQIRMQIDIGFGDAIEPPPTDAHYPTLLDNPRPHIRIYPREAVIAEKLHAMVVLGERNSRNKDFYDLYALSQHFDFEGNQLVRAMRATFDRRCTTFSRTLPVALTRRFYADAERSKQWRTYLDRNELSDIPSDCSKLGERLVSFFKEPWDALARGFGFSGHWTAGGPWRHE